MIEFGKITGRMKENKLQVSMRTGENFYATISVMGTGVTTPSQKWIDANKDNFLAMVIYRHSASERVFHAPIIIGFYPVAGYNSVQINSVELILRALQGLIDTLINAKINTSIGPQPFMPDIIQQLQNIQNNLDDTSDNIMKVNLQSSPSAFQQTSYHPATPRAASGFPSQFPSSVGGVSGECGLNIDAAVTALNNNAHSRSTGYCARYVRLALEAGGLFGFTGDAKDYSVQLQQRGFTVVSQSGYIPQKGDIVVFNSAPGHPSGHIAMYNGSQWVSDFFQNSFFVSGVYRVQNDYVIFRCQKAQSTFLTV